MLSLCCDLFLKISELLTDKEKIYLTMTCKKMDELKHKFRYHKKIDICLIRNLSYFDNFESVASFFPESKYPKHAKYIYFFYSNILSDKFIPKLVTHLEFNPSFNNS